MPKNASEPGIEPCLVALGGWSAANWFCPSVLSDPDVVAFELPKVPGMRKQGFRVIDRTEAKPSRKAGQDIERAPKRTAGKLALLLDGFGAVRAVASCRTRFLFESGPVLFFAEIRSARLKPRSATRLRRELVEIGLKACVVRADSQSATVMVWPFADQGLTAFVEAASPEHVIHPDFDSLRPASAVRTARLRAGTSRPEQPDRDREAKLLRQIATLRAQVDALTRAQSALGAMEQLGLDDVRLKSMLKLLHPDRHANSEAANDAAKWLNNLRDLLRGKAG